MRGPHTTRSRGCRRRSSSHRRRAPRRRPGPSARSRRRRSASRSVGPARTRRRAASAPSRRRPRPASPRSSARTCAMYSRTPAHGSASLPIAMRPVKPVPIATATRPGASCSSVAIALACTSGWRRFGTSTAGPSPMRSVCAAASASTIQTSLYSEGESYNHAGGNRGDSACSDVRDDAGRGRERTGDLHREIVGTRRRSGNDPVLLEVLAGTRRDQTCGVRRGEMASVDLHDLSVTTGSQIGRYGHTSLSMSIDQTWPSPWVQLAVHPLARHRAGRRDIPTLVECLRLRNAGERIERRFVYGMGSTITTLRPSGGSSSTDFAVAALVPASNSRVPGSRRRRSSAVGTGWPDRRASVPSPR